MRAIILSIAFLANADPGLVEHLLLRFRLVQLFFGLALSLAAIFWALRNAREGYEDKNGFHFKQSRPVISHSPGVAIIRPRNAG